MYKRESDCRHRESIHYDYSVVNRTHGGYKEKEKQEEKKYRENCSYR